MINREDMLELTRRMTPARTSFVRMAGCYTDSDGEYDGSFNIHFLKLSGSEKARNLAIAKKIPFAESNEKLREYRFPETSQGPGSIWQMLMALRECGLKNDALLETFYDILIEGLQIHGAYAIYMFYDRYDIPAKASDKERLGESEEMFPYLICAVCPLVGEYEPGNPICGFLFPAFVDRSGDLERVDIYAERAAWGDQMASILGAKGSVVILGRLEGSVHAGACGDDKAYVAALSMKPAYMRIGDVKAGRSLLAICRQSFKHPQIAVMGENRLVLDSL